MAALLYQSRPSSRLWFALTASAVLHCAAVGIAEINRHPTPEAGAHSEASPDIDVESGQEPAPPASEPNLPDIPLPVTPADESLYQEEMVPLPPVRSHPRSTPLVGPPVPRSGSTSLASTRAFAVHAPRLEYPYEARRGRITGTGVAVLTIDPSGRVSDVAISQSTGSAVLDQATIAGFRRWRFKAGTPPTVRCPITYTLTGVTY